MFILSTNNLIFKQLVNNCKLLKSVHVSRLKQGNPTDFEHLKRVWIYLVLIIWLINQQILPQKSDQYGMINQDIFLRANFSHVDLGIGDKVLISLYIRLQKHSWLVASLWYWEEVVCFENTFEGNEERSCVFVSMAILLFYDVWPNEGWCIMTDGRRSGMSGLQTKRDLLLSHCCGLLLWTKCICTYKITSIT